MIKVQTLRLRGLCASTLLALAACSGTSTVEPRTADPSGGAGTQQPTAGSQGRGGQGQGTGQQAPIDRTAILEQAMANARRSMELRLFEDARNEAAFALELDNQNAEARDILRRCSEILGDKVSTGGGRFSEEVFKDRIREERERLLVAQEMETGEAHMQQGNFGRAIESFERAVTMLRYSMYAQPGDPLRKQAEARLTAAIAAKAQAEQDALARQAARSKEDIDRAAREEQIARELRVARLIDDANVQFQLGRYPEAVQRLDQALLHDPTNSTALALRELADRARHGTQIEMHRERWRQEWTAAFDDLRFSNIPQTETVVFDPARWAEVSQREPAAYGMPEDLESPESREILRRLDETVLEHQFASATVQDWATYYGNVTGVTFFVTQEVRDMDAATTTLNEFRLPRRSVASALAAIRSQTGVGFRVRDGIVHLVGAANATGTLYLQPYTVSDLVQGVKGRPGPDLKLPIPGDDSPLYPEEDGDPAPTVIDDGRLQDLIKEVVANGKWDGSPFTISYQSGVLYVRADRETHEAVARLIQDLRRHVGIQIDVEARFLKVEDSFLEDVGVDLRGLGNQAAEGLPGRGLERNNRQNAGFDDFGPKVQQNPATPGVVGTGTEPGVFFDDGGDGDIMGRVENLYNTSLGGRNGGPTNAGGLSVQYAFLDDTQVEIVLRAVAKQERSEQIEAPRLLVYNNARGSMSVLRNISYIRDFEVEIAQAAAVANPVIGVVHDGVALDVRPVVDADLKFITMELRPTVMSLQLPIPTFTTTLGIGQPISIQLPEVTLQRVRTTVTMPDGGTMMLGGMRLVERQNLRSTVPLVGDLPGVGWLFSRQGQSVLNRKILILIRAKIILMDEQEPEAIALPDGSVLTAKR